MFWPTILITVCAVGLITGIVWAVENWSRKDGKETMAAASGPTEAGVLIECFVGGLPTVMPPSGRVYVLNTFPVPIENGGSGLAEYFTVKPGGEMKWPAAKGGFPVMAYACRLTSFRNEPILQISMAVRLKFMEAVNRQGVAGVTNGPIVLDRPWAFQIAKLEPGSQNYFEFFVVNHTNRFVEISFYETIEARQVSSNERKKIPLLQPATTNMSFVLVPFVGEEQ